VVPQRDFDQIGFVVEYGVFIMPFFDLTVCQNDAIVHLNRPVEQTVAFNESVFDYAAFRQTELFVFKDYRISQIVQLLYGRRTYILLVFGFQIKVESVVFVTQQRLDGLRLGKAFADVYCGLQNAVLVQYAVVEVAGRQDVYTDLLFAQLSREDVSQTRLESLPV